MSFSNTWEAKLLSLIFANANAANLGDGTGLRGSSTAGSVYIALHTADPGEAGDQQSNEISYTGYARVGVVRTAGGSGWTISGTAPCQAANAALIQFGQCTVGTPTATYVSVGTASSGAGEILLSGQLTAPLAISPGITPQFAIGACVFTLE